MDERNVRGITPGDEDPIVHRYLVALPRFEPRRGFEARVLMRVWRPLPPTLRRLRDALERSHAPAIVLGVLAFGAFVWQAALVGLVLSLPAEARAVAVDFVNDWVPMAWNTVRDQVTELATPVLGYLGGYWTPEIFWATAVAAVLAIGCAFGLYWTMRLQANTGGVTHGSH